MIRPDSYARFRRPGQIAERPRVLIQVTHGFHVRMLFGTGVVNQLTESGCDVSALVPNPEEGYIVDEFGALGVEPDGIPFRASAVELLITNVRPFLLHHGKQDGTMEVKWERYQQNRPWRSRAVALLNPLFRTSAATRRAALRLERTCFPGREYDSVLQAHRPDLVLTGTPGFDLRDAHLLRAAHRLGRRTATVMLSWDNLTTRGEMAPPPQVLFVWNEIMKQEAIEIHGFPPHRIQVVGAPQFDHYSGRADDRRRPAFCQRHGLPGDSKLIVWGTVNEAVLPGQFEVLRSYIENHHRQAINEHLWVRVHPQSVRGSYAKDRPDYESLRGPRVTIELPPVRSDDLQWDLDPSDRGHLADLLSAAHVVVTPQSTLALDAACVDTPIVALAIGRPARRLFQYRHYRLVIDTGAVTLVESVQDLRAAVGSAIAHPEQRRAERAALRRAEMGPNFGRAAAECASAVSALAHSRSTTMRPHVASSGSGG